MRLKGNARLIHLHRLDWDEIRAIVQRGTDLLKEGGHDAPTTLAQWRSMIEKCKKYYRPLDQYWLGVPIDWADHWSIGARLIIPSRGYLIQNLVYSGYTAGETQGIKTWYEEEFRHDATAVLCAGGLEDIPLTAADGAALLPVERDGKKPWTGFPGGKPAYLRALLDRTVDHMDQQRDPFRNTLKEDIKTALEHL